MTKKNDYSRSDWNAIVSAPMLIAAGVASADGGFLSTAPEMESLQKFLAESKTKYQGHDEFLFLVLSDIKKDWRDDWVKLKQVIAVIDEKVPANEARNYKVFLYEAGVKVAEACTEGWFGSDPISKKEVIYLEKLKRLLNI